MQSFQLAYYSHLFLIHRVQCKFNFILCFKNYFSMSSPSLFPFLFLDFFFLTIPSLPIRSHHLIFSSFPFLSFFPFFPFFSFLPIPFLQSPISSFPFFSFPFLSLLFLCFPFLPFISFPFCTFPFRSIYSVISIPFFSLAFLSRSLIQCLIFSSPLLSFPFLFHYSHFSFLSNLLVSFFSAEFLKLYAIIDCRLSRIHVLYNYSYYTILTPYFIQHLVCIKYALFNIQSVLNINVRTNVIFQSASYFTYPRL